MPEKKNVVSRAINAYVDWIESCDDVSLITMIKNRKKK
jgi:hypothetical protein